MLAVISLVLCWGILVYILVYKSEKVLVSKPVKVNRIHSFSVILNHWKILISHQYQKFQFQSFSSSNILAVVFRNFLNIH